MRECVLAADLGGTNIRVAKVSSTGRISHYRQVLTPPAGGLAVVDALAALLEQIPRKDVLALGVDVPGLVNIDGNVWAPNIRGWKRVPLGPRLQKRLDLPVVVESDRNACVVGETWKGVAKGLRDVVFVSVGTGIGAGIMIDGHLLRGHSGTAGSIGWMAVRDKFLPQYAKVGCLESHAAGVGIGATASHLYQRSLTAQEVTQLAIHGSVGAQRVLDRAGRYLGMALANLVNILGPEIIVVGGGVIDSDESVFRTAIQTMKLWAHPIAIKQTRVIRSQLKGTAELLGIAKLAFGAMALPVTYKTGPFL